MVPYFCSNHRAVIAIHSGTLKFKRKTLGQNKHFGDPKMIVTHSSKQGLNVKGRRLKGEVDGGGNRGLQNYSFGSWWSGPLRINEINEAAAVPLSWLKMLQTNTYLNQQFTWSCMWGRNDSVHGKLNQVAYSQGVAPAVSSQHWARTWNHGNVLAWSRRQWRQSQNCQVTLTNSHSKRLQDETPNTYDETGCGGNGSSM